MIALDLFAVGLDGLGASGEDHPAGFIGEALEHGLLSRIRIHRRQDRRRYLRPPALHDLTLVTLRKLARAKGIAGA
jgi:hypothetical protein